MSSELLVANRGRRDSVAPGPTPDGGPRRAGVRRWLRAAVNLVVSLVALAAVAVLLLVAVGPRVADYRTLVMLTGSMTPAYPTGSLLVVTRQPTADLAPGDVLTYQVPVGDRPVVTHRVVEVDRTGEGLLVQTKGDANADRDPWVATITDDTVWTVRGAVPVVGQVIGWTRSTNIRPIVTLALPGLALTWFLVGIWRKKPQDDDAVA